MANNLIELEGSRVSLKGEMVSLTGLWKAAGSPDNRDPRFWVRQDGVQSFIDVLADAENVTVHHLFRATRGRNGATWAHWQIALAYAKYLSPEFHLKCNAVIRQHMEHRLPVHADFPAELLEMIKRTDGICRMLAHKVTKIEQAVTDGGQHEPAAFTITVEPRKGKQHDLHHLTEKARQRCNAGRASNPATPKETEHA